MRTPACTGITNGALFLPDEPLSGIIDWNQGSRSCTGLRAFVRVGFNQEVCGVGMLGGWLSDPFGLKFAFDGSIRFLAHVDAWIADPVNSGYSALKLGHWDWWGWAFLVSGPGAILLLQSILFNHAWAFAYLALPLLTKSQKPFMGHRSGCG